MSEPMPDRASLMADFERVRADFQRLMALAEENDWAKPTLGTRWTNEQLLFHMVFATPRAHPHQIPPNQRQGPSAGDLAVAPTQESSAKRPTGLAVSRGTGDCSWRRSRGSLRSYQPHRIRKVDHVLPEQFEVSQGRGRRGQPFAPLGAPHLSRSLISYGPGMSTGGAAPARRMDTMKDDVEAGSVLGWRSVEF